VFHYTRILCTSIIIYYTLYKVLHELYQWVQNFRMSEETFIYLYNKMRPAMEKQDTTFRKCVPLKMRLAMALWKLATSSDYRTVGHLFGVSITIVCRCVQEFAAAAEMLLVPEQICFPDQEKFAEMAAYTESRWGNPAYHCDYFNRKGWHSIIPQGVVDGKGLFWNVFAGLPGSLHDARVLRLSTLWELASRGNYFPASTRNIGGVNAGYYILGDFAYPLQNWLLKPFHDTGRLKAENLIYSKKNLQEMTDVELVKSMVLTFCALHNLCETHGEAYDNDWDASVAAEPVVALSQVAEEEGRDVREGLMHFF
uniref:DDE Tnp4 domain-containing protein n=1 Tax=Sander lucioperca TaxID=283035 RepID=A0A8C9WQ70_SANLU